MAEERVLTPGAAAAYAAVVALTLQEATDLVTQLNTYDITQPGITTWYRMLKALAP